ncbi:Spc98 family-domain-containing protein [Paraphoma chrysanthemicola]|nr:Spc98 family-domain-containing protein [Paraphoma chrysanthemicola]
MAQNAKISGLTDELIHAILRFDPATNKQAYRHARESASRRLRGHQFARTNQFDVASAFAGLDEKFRVKNRDDLADALQVRLQKLEGHTSRFTPDILALLLQLSDRPLENTRVEALDLLQPPSPPRPLTWAEMLQDDPYSDDDIWKDIDYAVASSGDEQTTQTRPRAKPLPLTSVEQDDSWSPDACIVPSKEDLVQHITADQFWSAAVDDNDTKLHITELQAIRETLFMLAGLRTNLYLLDKQHSNIRINPRYLLRHAMYDTMSHLLVEFAEIGRETYRLRQWTKRTSSLQLVQAFEAAVRTRLVQHDDALAKIQATYLTPTEPVAVSLLCLLDHVRSVTAPILRLARIVSRIEPELLVNPFRHLEALFEDISLSQMTLESNIFQYLSGVFFECLKAYLKPIRKWMKAGELPMNDETFFIFQSDASSDVMSLWHDRYVLRKDALNDLRAPSFLQPAMKRVFNTGKSVIFLRELGFPSKDSTFHGQEPHLDHETVCGASDTVPLAAFEELFRVAFDKWMQSTYSQASSVLRQHLVETCGLVRTLATFAILYLGKNGAVFEDFASALFERLDAGRKGWNDRYVLTEVTRSIFGTAMAPAEAERIVVRSSKPKNGNTPLRELATIKIDYALPWPIQNIILRSSIPEYQQLFTALLQVYRVKCLLQRLDRERSSRPKSRIARLIHRLRHRLHWFADTLRSYLTETVIFFSSLEMNAALDKAKDIDQMTDVHSNYVVKLQERALLADDMKPIQRAIVDVLELGVTFTAILIKGAFENVSSGEDRSTKSRYDKKAEAPEEDDDWDADFERDVSEGSHPVSRREMLTSLSTIDDEYSKLLPFIIAGLRSVGRVGAEPMWEQLADRLSWEGKASGLQVDAGI